MSMSEKQERIYIVTTDLRSFRVARDVLRDVSGESLQVEGDKEKLQKVHILLSELEASNLKQLRKLTG